MDKAPNEQVLFVDVDELEAAMQRGGSPSPDDVTVLADGTRLDTEEKSRAWIAEILRRRHVGEPTV